LDGHGTTTGKEKTMKGTGHTITSKAIITPASDECIYTYSLGPIEHMLHTSDLMTDVSRVLQLRAYAKQLPTFLELGASREFNSFTYHGLRE
jgi:hypothetical protein